MPSEPQNWHIAAFGALLGVVAMNVTASILLKLDANPNMAGERIFGFGWPVLAGMMCYAVALVLYAWSLRYIDLHIAQVTVSLQFAGTILAAALIFRETIGTQQMVGIALIFVGLIVCVK